MNLGPRVQPKISFVPIIMRALTNADTDAETKAFKQRLGAKLVKQLTDNWSRMPTRDKYNRYFMSREQPLSGNFATQMAMASKLWAAEREAIVRKRKETIKKEVDRALVMGVGNYEPSLVVAADKTILYEVNKWISHKLYYTCRCEQAGATDAPPPEPPKKFGVKVSKLKCHDQRETGHDEIYLVSAAVDGNGKLVSMVSNKLSIDDDDDDVLYPNYYVYPMQDPNGFLDLAIAMWEDDGGYGGAATYVTSIGAAIATIPSPYTIVAGVALQIIGGLIGLASWLDDDDHYGDAYKTWASSAALQAGVGSYILSYYEVDTGWSDDGHDFDLTINLMSA